MRIPFVDVEVFKDESRSVSKEVVWVCLYEGYVHFSDTLLGLLREVVTEFRHDRHLVG